MSLDLCTTPARGRERVALGGAASSMPPMGKLEVWDSVPGGGVTGLWFTGSQEPGSGGGTGLNLHGRAADGEGIGYWLWRDGVMLWGTGLDATSTDFVFVYNQATRSDIMRFRQDDARCEWGPTIGHPSNPAQLSLHGGTAAVPYLALALGANGTTYDGLQITQGVAGSKQAGIAFGGTLSVTGSDWRLGEDLGGANTSEFGLWDTAAGAYRWQIDKATGKFLIQAGGLGVPNRVAKTTLASPGTVTGAIEVFSAAGVSLGSVPVYSNISFS